MIKLIQVFKNEVNGKLRWPFLKEGRWRQNDVLGPFGVLYKCECGNSTGAHRNSDKRKSEAKCYGCGEYLKFVEENQMTKRADFQLKKQPIVIGEVKESNKDRLVKLQLLQKEELTNNGNTDYAKDLQLSIERLQP